MILNEAEKVVYLNPRFTRQFSCSVEAVSSLRDWWALVCPDSEKRLDLKKRWSEAVERSQSGETSRTEFSVVCADGHLRRFEFRLTSVESATVVFAADISDRAQSEAVQRALLRRLEESRSLLAESLLEKTRLIGELTESMQQLKEMNAMKNKLFSIIAHDLRSPFNIFLILSRTLKDELSSLSAEEIQDFVGVLHASAAGVYELLEDLLEWASIQRGSIRLRPCSCDLGEVVGRNLGFFREAAERKGLTLRQICPEGMRLTADPHLLDTILRNLLANAVKFTPRGGTVEVEGRPPFGEKFCEIIVRDTGIGIPPEILERLFYVGARTGREGTEGESSSGFGLILCKEFVELHRGKISAKSKVGVGSSFHIKLPASD